MFIVLLAVAAFLIVATALSIVRADAWWIRVFDFPRLQLAVLCVLVLGGLFFYRTPDRWVSLPHVASVLVLACLVYQALRVLPYTPPWPNQVLLAEGEGPRLSLVISNVLMKNRDADRLRAELARYDPDLVLLVETDRWWQAQMDTLKGTHPHTLAAPIDNTYGMLLYSRLPLQDPEIRYMLEPDIPSFHASVEVGGMPVMLHFIHPKPPAPQEAKTTEERDAEILLVGKEVRETPKRPTLVAGDLNDVAWSRTTRLFQKTSGLLDPRRGRGMYNTFSADYFFLRWPLDHVFHSEHFKLVRLERLPHVGSDHFPVFIELQLAPEAPAEQEPPEADGEDLEEAEEAIEEGKG